MDLALANKVIEGSLVKAKELGRNFSIVVLDEGGHLVAAQRMEGANFLTPDIAIGKAYGCVAFGRTSAQLVEMATRNPTFITALVEMTNGKMVAALGGARLILDGRLIGSVGASGATAEQDQEVADAGAVAAGLAG
ncbi:MAG: heme-binding protein [Chloroflexi bacterium]|nr:heme-binding protein [Chloroflexota bacterium]